MAKYVALLRGIAPTNPNMHQAKLVGVLEKLGLGNVQAVISSGNVIFDYGGTDVRGLETRIEDAWPKALGFKSTTILRSQKQLTGLVARDPYEDAGIDPKFYRLVTFFKRPKRLDIRVPHQPAGKPYVIVAASPRDICSAIDVTGSKTPDFMVWLEREYGKDITSRTWNTVHRILKKMGTALLWILLSIGAAGTANAQIRSDCRSPQPPSVGVSIGRSDPYIELVSGAVETEPNGSISVRSGAQLAGRADLPVAGPLRVRFEATTARWDVRQTVYDPDAGYRVISETSVGHMSARHLVALVGLRAGRAPACAHVSVGGGLYSIGFRGASVRRPGFAIAAGMEIPTGTRGAVQLDATLHLIGTRDAPPIASTAVPALSLLAGWAYRF